MAIRPIYISTNIPEMPFIQRDISFEWIKGMSYSQKCKRRDSLKKEIAKQYDINKWLEISTKSDKEIGVKLSALNLKILTTKKIERPVEEIYQSSKVFENGKIISFKYGNTTFPNDPYSMYYDYVYMLGLYQNQNLWEEFSKYSIFTDIEFNPNKQLNTQARAAAIFKTLLENNSLKILENQEEFKTYYKSINKK